MTIKESDVAGASSGGDRFIKHTRSGGGVQQQRPEEGGPQKVYPFADWKQGACAPWEKSRPDPPWCCSDAEAPACALHPAARAGCPPPVGGGARREGGPKPRRARFRRRLCFCANFFCCGGCIGSSAFVSCCWRGLGVRAAASPRRRSVPPREKCKGEQTHVRRPPPPAGLQKGALAWAHYVKTAFPHSPRIPTGSFGGPERWMDAKGLLGRLRWRLRRRPWRRGRELLGAFAAHLLAFQGDLLGSAPRV